MPLKLYPVALILILLLGACTPTADDLGTAPATPGVMPRLDPSPTRSVSTLPLTCQVTDLNVYVNALDGYCFAYPTDFSLGEQPSERPEVRGPALGGAEPVYATFQVEVTPAAAGKSLREQAEVIVGQLSAADPASLTWTPLQVGGESAWMVEPVPVQLSWRIVFVQHADRLFSLMYWPVDLPEAQSDLDALTQTTLGSFAFMD